MVPTIPERTCTMLRWTVVLLILIPSALVLAEDRELIDMVEVEITTLEGFNVVGMVYQGSDTEGVIALWEDFTPRIQEIPGVNMDGDGYGVLVDYDDETGEFTYLACTGSDMAGTIPYGMIGLGIREGEYAVFTFPFSLLDEIYGYVYGTWLPESEYSHGDGYDFEYYPADFIPSDEGVLMQLFVSVE